MRVSNVLEMMRMNTVLCLYMSQFAFRKGMKDK